MTLKTEIIPLVGVGEVFNAYICKTYDKYKERRVKGFYVLPEMVN